MKFLILTMASTLVLGTSAYAQDQSPTEGAVKAMDGAEKKSRKKKVEICGECGKPETECECHGKGGQKDSKKGDKKHLHEHDEHAH